MTATQIKNPQDIIDLFEKFLDYVKSIGVEKVPTYDKEFLQRFLDYNFQSEILRTNTGQLRLILSKADNQIVSVQFDGKETKRNLDSTPMTQEEYRAWAREMNPDYDHDMKVQMDQHKRFTKK